MVPKEEFKQILVKLRTEFPGAFPKGSFRIFKKGIDLDILKAGVLKIGRTKLRDFLKIYTSHPSYILVHVKGADRYDLEGNVVAKVTEQEFVNIRKLDALRQKQKRFLQAKVCKATSGGGY